MRSLSHLTVPFLLLAFSAYELREKGETGMLGILLAVAGLLLFFTAVSALLRWKKAALAQEVSSRTETWWWMAAVFMLAFSTHRLVSFLFLGFLCFSALREYFSLLPMRDASEGQILSFRDRPSILVAYCMVPLSIYVAYIRWYELFIILVPVYFFLLIPILFVIQDRTEGALKSMGAISLGTLFFAFCLGHALFMINVGPMLLFFCFFLTESRDVIAFWVGKALGALTAALPEGGARRLLELRVAPTVTPRKTWAGGLLSALAVAGLAVAVRPLLPPFGGAAATREFCAVAGFAIGFFGLFGDLVFGMVKRDIGVKDTGSLLPGHGGVIDRVNGLVFTVPLTFHLFYWRFF